jgi:hypothetical protein
MSDVFSLAYCELVEGGEARGVNAQELDGARVVLLHFVLERSRRRLRPLGLTLEDAVKLRDGLSRAIAGESAKRVG